jgi:hypothetical protein
MIWCRSLDQGRYSRPGRLTRPGKSRPGRSGRSGLVGGLGGAGRPAGVVAQPGDEVPAQPGDEVPAQPGDRRAAHARAEEAGLAGGASDGPAGRGRPAQLGYRGAGPAGIWKSRPSRGLLLCRPELLYSGPERDISA